MPTIIEHAVFYKVVRNAAIEKRRDWMRQMNELKNSQEGILRFTAGPLYRNFNKPNRGYTHVLHCRFKDKASLDAFIAGPGHMKVVKDYEGIVDEFLPMQWEETLDSLPLDDDIAAKRLVAFRVDKGVDVDDFVKKHRDFYSKNFPGLIKQVSVGKNLVSGEYRQGVDVGFLVLLDDLKKMGAISHNPTNSSFLMSYSYASAELTIMDYVHSHRE